MGDFWGDDKEYKRAATGVTQAVCCDVELQRNVEKEWQGHKKTVSQIRFKFEVPEVNSDTGKRFTISAFFTASMHEKAGLRKFLSTWLGKTISDEEATRLKTMDFEEFKKEFLGKNALLTLIDSKDERWTNIGGISPTIAGMPPLQIVDYKPKDDGSVPF